jgi:hypothetical protein
MRLMGDLPTPVTSSFRRRPESSFCVEGKLDPSLRRDDES